MTSCPLTVASVGGLALLALTATVEAAPNCGGVEVTVPEIVSLRIGP